MSVHVSSQPCLFAFLISLNLSPFLFSLQFFDRIKLFGMPAKHQPDLIYLRYVPLWKVHIFTLVQLTCLVLLWVIKASAAAVVFPMMVPTSDLKDCHTFCHFKSAGNVPDTHSDNCHNTVAVQLK